MKTTCSGQSYLDLCERLKRGEIFIHSQEVGKTPAEWLVDWSETTKHMRVLTLAEIQKLEPGETIPSFNAQIKEVKPYNQGTHAEYGPWTIQNLTVMDESGIVPVKIKNHHEFGQDWRNCHAYFESGKSQKDGGLTGIKWKEDTYKGKTTRLIEVTASATIDRNGDQPDHGMYSKKDSFSPQTPDPRQPALPDTKQAIQDAKERLGRAANGLILCYDATVYLATEVMKRHSDVVFGPGELERIAVHLSISLEKNGVVHGLPVGPMDQWRKKE